MSKTVRTVLIITFSCLLAFVIGIITINQLIKNKVENFLENRLPETVTQSHDDLILDTFGGTITIINPSVAIKNATNDSTHTKVSLKRLVIEDVSYWDYLFNKEIHIEDIQLTSPNITYYPNKFTKKQDTSKSNGLLTVFKPIRVDSLRIDNASLQLYDGKKDSVLVSVKNATIAINDIFIDREIITQRLPVTFNKYQAEADSIFVRTSPYEHLTVHSFNLKDHRISIQDIALKTKYSRAQLSKVVPKERDHFDLVIPKIELQNFDFGFKNRKLFVKSTKLSVESPTLDIFRDKLVKDDPSVKKMYSELLRTLPFDLTIKEAQVTNGTLAYTEKVKDDNTGGTITISDLNSDITHLSNTYKSNTKTEIETTGKFMEVSPFTTTWMFDVNNTNDAFTFTMDASDLPANDLNSFTVPNLKVRLEGILQKNYLTINGNARSSHIDMRLKYDDFKVVVLSDNGKDKNWLLSTVANIFVAKDSKSGSDVFREGSADVTRDRTKSIFNFLWLNIKEGLLASMTGRNKSD